MSSTRQTDRDLRRRQRATAAALAALARATPADAANALRLWQSRTGRTDAELLAMLEQLEGVIKAVPQGTSLALAAAEVPAEPSPELELYTQIFAFLHAVSESASNTHRDR